MNDKRRKKSLLNLLGNPVGGNGLCAAGGAPGEGDPEDPVGG
jgi:hypothetical protein